LLLLTSSPLFSKATDFVKNGNFTANSGNSKLGFNASVAGLDGAENRF
jgi:hypothetical protein